MTFPALPRRTVLAAAGGGLAASLLPGAARAALTAPSLAEDAFVWGLPLLLSGRYLALARQSGAAFNTLVLSPELATPAVHAAGPNVDTLYGYAWLDLAAEPQIFTVPDTNDRYYSIQLIDAWQNAFAYIGRRATGTKAGAFAVTPPGYTGALPPGVTEIKAPTRTVVALVRTLVRGPADIEAAKAVHFSYRLGGVSAFPDRPGAPTARSNSINVFPRVDLTGVGKGWRDELQPLLSDYPPLPFDAPNLARFAPLGLGAPGPGNPLLDQALADAVPAGLGRIKGSLYADSWEANGWRTKLGVVPFPHDPLRRAANNIYGPGTHIAQEALYFGAREGPDGKPLSGASIYRLRFAAGQTPPVDAFWSLILYDKNFFLFDNPINRYSINDRSEGLHFGSDGSLEILIQAKQPGDPNANWLPAPPDSFQLTIRAYQPRQVILDKRYRLPPLEIVAV